MNIYVIPIPYMVNENIAQEFRLTNIKETTICFIEEINQNESRDTKRFVHL